jgi:aromatic ring-opening dioxygenase LigB subunit
MPLVYAAIVPHPPLLIPTIGREHTAQLTKTKDSFDLIAEELYVVRPETIIIISPHGAVHHQAFNINLSPNYSGNLEKFGDHATRSDFVGDVGLSYQIREKLETKEPLQLFTDSNLDYGSFIPLHLLFGTQNTKPQIIPIHHSSLGLDEHFSFGQALQHEISISGKRIAVLASGDLSNRLTPNSPAGYSPKAEKFDNKLVELLLKNKTKEVLDLSPELISEAGACGLKPIVMLLGILEGFNAEPQRLAYEAPFGVGYLTLKYNL